MKHNALLSLLFFTFLLSTLRPAIPPLDIKKPHEAKSLHMSVWGKPEDGDEPKKKNMSQIQLLGKDLGLFFGGRLRDDAFAFQHAYTLRSDYHDEINYIRHKLNLDFVINQGEKKYGKPASEACVRLTNYVFWQKESNYMPMTVEEITLPDADNVVVARDVKVKTLMPLIFVEQAWFKLNFDVFAKTFHDRETYLKVGYFPYHVGRGVALGHHEDLAVDYLGWAGDGGFTRYPFMPPGILFSTAINDNLTWDVYFNLWRETNASLSDVLKPERASRLYGPPERGSGKDRTLWATKLDYSKTYDNVDKVLMEPYFIYVNAPEQGIEFDADASGKLFTAGAMVDWHHKNVSVNVEAAGQFGEQHVHAIDRNVVQVTKSTNTGAITASFSHIVLTAGTNEAERSSVADGRINAAIENQNPFNPDKQLAYIVNTPNNRDLTKQGFEYPTITAPTANVALKNLNLFDNARFRPAYKLAYRGFMALADIAYDFENHPFKIAGSLGHISGDNYPYNDECNQTFNGFIPLRSRYRGLGTQNFLMFDRQVTPRPLNISYRTLSAFNDLKDLSNLQFIGFGATWYPYNNRKKCSITSDIMFLWEAATLKKWDKNGTHPDPTIEAQLKRLRNTDANGVPTKFSGWESGNHARRMLGTEIDLKVWYKLLDHCDFYVRTTLFFPGGLYKDLDGQPNVLTQRVDEQNYTRFDSLGHVPALAFVVGLDYRF